ncbi:acyltransferase family protein [Hydrogenophaga sp. BPS33]|uniref:acyltransferase family protein n=1 Tax=Hydrogenophaga sp. BPS33 TaxID=2651974 RepID=UPI00131F4B04|nr:acyltransferase [Hydrogenophaga sp. BPS33]QHE85939.1 acyltransferase [Hydrogenophaga sp. BPS33]
MTEHTHALDQRQPSLDWLRGVAAMMVVLFHYCHAGLRDGWFKGEQHPVVYAVTAYGYVGVHLFFMISGYVIMMTAQHANTRRFMASRVSRLAPALWVCVTLTALVELAVPTAPIKPESWAQYFANLTLVPRVFDEAYMDGAYWSLAVEINFYAMVALAIATGQLKRIETLLLLWLALSLVNYLRPMHTVQVFTSAQWAPLFTAGAIFYLVKQSGWTARRLLSISGSTLLACLYLWRENGVVPDLEHLLRLDAGPNHLVIEAILLSFFGFFFCMVHGKVRVKSSRWSLLAGRLTYPLYLVHQHAGYALFSLAAASGLTAAVGLSWVTVGLLALAVAAAWLVNVCVEEPWSAPLRRWLAGAGRTKQMQVHRKALKASK